MKVISVKDEAEWHRVRAKYVGGSEIAALFGLSPYLTRYELWHTKAGNLSGSALENERMKAGKFMEPAIAAWAADEWGVPLRKFHGYAPHATVAGMGCTPDYINDDASLIVQIKNVDSLEFHQNPKWQASGNVLTEAPMHILLQCQHEIACTGITKGWLVACVGGNRLTRMELEPREKTIAKLEAEVKAFWDSVHLGQEPKPDFEADAATIAAMCVDTQSDTEIDLSASNRAHECIAEFLRGKAMEKDGEKLAETHKAELLLMMGSNARARVGDAIIVNSLVKGSAGKAITAGMIGMITGVRKPYRKFDIKQQQQGAQ